ncbi:hypothetical protein [Clostridium scatologenes]|uniref:Uncharacterized protein n=1 Tax=Clostridium scatologenes TaxID=1548 RepID=A0A0E3GPU2_CLOSL|nr:hypothetical protein [Clostridium scatologenes]AKA67416.1 hypothetical protein CSCA_0291 [Clostridium scatologenes]
MNDIRKLQKPLGKVYKHQHHHSHEGKCGCNHEHSKEELYGELKEVPAVFSNTISLELNKEILVNELEKSLEAWIESLKKWVLENKYFIGHIKAFIEGGENFNVWIATTGKETNIKTSENHGYEKIKGITVNITAIVFGTDEKTLKFTTLKKLEELLHVKIHC